jgi:hypothetical protein
MSRLMCHLSGVTYIVNPDTSRRAHLPLVILWITEAEGTRDLTRCPQSDAIYSPRTAILRSAPAGRLDYAG